MKRLGTTLALEIAVALVCVMAAFGIFGVRQQQRQYRQLAEENEQHTLQTMSLILSTMVFDVVQDQIVAVMQSYLQNAEIYAIKISEQGTPSYHWAKDLTNGTALDVLQASVPLPTYPASISKQIDLNYRATVIGQVEVIFSRQGLNRQVQRVVEGIVISFLFVLLMETLLILFLINRQVTRPLQRLTRLAKQIAQGDLMAQVEKSSARNEIGVLTTAFEALLAYIRSIAQAALSIADGDLGTEIAPRSEVDRVGQAFQAMVVYLRDMAAAATAIAQGDLRREVQPKTPRDVLGTAFQNMTSLRQRVSHIIQQSDDLRSAAAVLAQMSMHMASNTEETSQQMTYIAASAEQINSHINEVSTAAEELAANIRQISNDISTVKEGLLTAVHTAQDASTTIAALQQHSEEIGAIVQMITAITQQTNMLALNATIEAARAGDSGRGFAVVANEVKELAKETARSADEIARRIAAIQASTGASVSAIANIAAMTTHTQDIAVTMAAAVEEQAVIAQQISHNMVSAAGGSNQMSRAFNEVTHATQDSTHQIVELQHEAERLRTFADELQQAMEEFKI